MVWSNDVSINAFVNVFAETVIDQIVTNVFDDVRSIIANGQALIKADQDSLEIAVTALKTKLATFANEIEAGLSR
jgi:ABC-type transporter MlaC component